MDSLYKKYNKLILYYDGKYKIKDVLFDVNVLCLGKFLYRAMLETNIIEELYNYKQRFESIEYINPRFDVSELMLEPKLKYKIIGSAHKDYTDEENETYFDSLEEIFDKCNFKDNRVMVLDINGNILYRYEDDDCHQAEILRNNTEIVNCGKETLFLLNENLFKFAYKCFLEEHTLL